MADFLRANLLKPVFHGGKDEIHSLRESMRIYNTLTTDSSRVKNRIKAVYRARGISCAGDSIYNSKNRDEWLQKLGHAALQNRVSFLFEELDSISSLRGKAEKQALSALKAHKEKKLLMSVPGIGPLRAADLISTVVAPHRFRNKRAFWTYCGFAVVTVGSGEFENKNGSLSRNSKKASTRGLNRNRCPRMKALFKEAAISAQCKPEFAEYKERLLSRGLSNDLVRVNIARKLATIVLTIWKKGELYSPEKMKMQQ